MENATHARLPDSSYYYLLLLKYISFSRLRDIFMKKKKYNFFCTIIRRSHRAYGKVKKEFIVLFLLRLSNNNNDLISSYTEFLHGMLKINHVDNIDKIIIDKFTKLNFPNDFNIRQSIIDVS